MLTYIFEVTTASGKIYVEKAATSLEAAEAMLERMQWTDPALTLEWQSYELYDVKQSCGRLSL